MTKILLTGGTGFIGRNILENLGNKYEFLAPSKQELDLRKETAVFKYLERNKVDLIIHAVSIGDLGKKNKKIIKVF